jgi:hypothetical protein
MKTFQQAILPQLSCFPFTTTGNFYILLNFDELLP